MSFLIKDIRYNEERIENTSKDYDIIPNVVATIKYENNGDIKYLNGVDINGESRIFVTNSNYYEDLEKNLSNNQFELLDIIDESNVEIDFGDCEETILLLHESITEYDALIKIMLYVLRYNAKDSFSKQKKDNVLNNCIDKYDNEIKLEY